MHGTAMLIQKETKGKVLAIDVMQAQLQQLINEEKQAGGASTTQLLPEAYVKKHKDVNEHISPFAMQLLESYELCDINKACMAQRDGGKVNKPIYTKPIVDKTRPLLEAVKIHGASAMESFFLDRVYNFFKEEDNPQFTSPVLMHDPALLNYEAYEYLFNSGRYAQPVEGKRIPEVVQ